MTAEWKHKSVLKSSLNQMLEGKFVDEQFSRLLLAMRISLKKGEKSNNEPQHFDEFFAFLNNKNFKLQLEIFW